MSTHPKDMDIEELYEARKELLAALGSIYSRFGPEGPYDDSQERAQDALEEVEAEIEYREGPVDSYIGPDTREEMAGER